MGKKISLYKCIREHYELFNLVVRPKATKEDSTHNQDQERSFVFNYLSKSSRDFLAKESDNILINVFDFLDLISNKQKNDMLDLYSNKKYLLSTEKLEWFRYEVKTNQFPHYSAKNKHLQSPCLTNTNIQIEVNVNSNDNYLLRFLYGFLRDKNEYLRLSFYKKYCEDEVARNNNHKQLKDDEDSLLFLKRNIVFIELFNCLHNFQNSYRSRLLTNCFIGNQQESVEESKITTAIQYTKELLGNVHNIIKDFENLDCEDFFYQGFGSFMLVYITKAIKESEVYDSLHMKLQDNLDCYVYVENRFHVLDKDTWFLNNNFWLFLSTGYTTYYHNGKEYLCEVFIDEDQAQQFIEELTPKATQAADFYAQFIKLAGRDCSQFPLTDTEKMNLLYIGKAWTYKSKEMGEEDHLQFIEDQLEEHGFSIKQYPTDSDEKKLEKRTDLRYGENYIDYTKIKQVRRLLITDSTSGANKRKSRKSTKDKNKPRY